MFINTDSILILDLILRIIIIQIKILMKYKKKKTLLIQELYVVEAPYILNKHWILF